MVSSHRIFDGRRLLVLLGLLLVAGFFATTLGSYFVSRNVIRAAIIGQELPLASINISVELKKDMVRAVLISSTMASNTFLRDWVLKGERDVSEMSRYLQKINTRQNVFSSFFVSERSARYYISSGILKKVSPTDPRDAWYYRVRELKDDYEINVDPDMVNKDAMTTFINYRVFDFAGNYIGVTGIGITMDAVHRRIKDYQQRYQSTIYFVDDKGRVIQFGGAAVNGTMDLHARPGLDAIVDRILQDKNGNYQYESDGGNRLLNVNYIPELKWYLFVEKDESVALIEVRKMLYINLAICLGITLLVLLLMYLSLSRYQRRLEEMAATDKLSGLLNRQAFTILMDRLMAEHSRQPRPLSILLLDVDHFKSVNDLHGHAAGDRVLRRVAELLRQDLRQSDIAVRWGGEEFLVVLDNCDLAEAQRIAEKIRERIAQERLDIDGTHFAVTISVGVSQFSGDEFPEQTISRADAGLYQAKNNGRNRVYVWVPEMPAV